MRMHYSHDVHAVYIRLKEEPVAETDEISEDVIVDYDAHGNVIGIELLRASEKTEMQRLVVQDFGAVTVERNAA